VSSPILMWLVVIVLHILVVSKFSICRFWFDPNHCH